jgi:hypothetical protein
MTLRWTSSFDNFQDSDRPSIFTASNAYDGGGSYAFNFGTTYSRWPSGKGIRLQGNVGTGDGTGFGTSFDLLFDYQPQWYCGVAVRPVTYPQGNTGLTYQVCSLMDVASYVIECRLTAAGVLVVTLNGTAIATGTVTLPTGVFSFVEFGVVLHPTAGSYTVRLNGANYLTASGVNTTATGTGQANKFRLGMIQPGTSGSQTASGEVWYDDLYIADGTGSGVNNFVGDCHPIELLPSSNGTYSDWAQTGGTGGSPYTAVSDTPNNGDTSYLSSFTPNQRTTFHFPTLPVTTSSVRAVAIGLWLRKDDANSHTVAARSVESSTESTSAASVGALAQYAFSEIVMETDPLDGASWTATKVNNSEFGVVLST